MAARTAQFAFFIV